MNRLSPLVLLLAAAPAAAGPFELHADLRVGAASGYGIAGDQKQNDFFDHTKGGTYGLLVGVRLLFFEASIEHDQFTDFSSVKGTWTELDGGIGGAIAVDDVLGGESNKLYVNFGLDVGAGFGTGRQISPPLDNAQISDKGILLNGHIGIEYRIWPFLALAAEFPAGWGYMLKNDVPATQDGSSYATFHFMVLGVVRGRIGF
jgi:Outer membrane protein beta-barrel domain